MPLYDYKCAEHGLFHELVTMENAAKPCKCPKCGSMSPRVIMIPPEVLQNAPAMKAREKNEQAQHQPIISSVDSRQEAAERKAHAHKHGKSCGCNHEANQSSLKQQVIYLPDGSKVFPSQRPWMISH